MKMSIVTLVIITVAIVIFEPLVCPVSPNACAAWAASLRASLKVSIGIYKAYVKVEIKSVNRFTGAWILERSSRNLQRLIDL